MGQFSSDAAIPFSDVTIPFLSATVPFLSATIPFLGDNFLNVELLRLPDEFFPDIPYNISAESFVTGGQVFELLQMSASDKVFGIDIGILLASGKPDGYTLSASIS